MSRGWYLATITCVKLSVGPITHVESYGQVHKSWRTGSCLPFGNCNCYYLYLVKCLFLFLFVCSVVALVLSLFCPEGYPVWLTQQTTLAIREILLLCEIFRGCYLYNFNPFEVIRLVASLQLAVLYPQSHYIAKLLKNTQYKQNYFTVWNHASVVNLLQRSHASVNRNYCNCKQAMLMKKRNYIFYCKQAMLVSKETNILQTSHAYEKKKFLCREASVNS